MIKQQSFTAALRTLILICTLFCTGTIQAQKVMLATTGSEAISSEIDENEPYKSRFFRVSESPRITVNNVFGGVEVYENEALGGVQVDIYVSRSFSLWSGARNLDNYRIILQQRGEQIIASVEDKRPGKNYKTGAGIEFNFVVQTPEEASVEIQSMAGDISLQGIKGKHYIQNHKGDIDLWKVSGETRVSSTEGDVEVADNDGILFMKTVTGNVFIENSSGEIRLKSIEGNLDIHEIQGTLVTSTVTGNTFTQFSEVTKGIFMKSVSGNIDLIIPPDMGYKITAEAMEFDFNELDLADSKSSVEFRNASLTIRDGEIPVNLSSVSGKITVKETN